MGSRIGSRGTVLISLREMLNERVHDHFIALTRSVRCTGARWVLLGSRDLLV